MLKLAVAVLLVVRSAADKVDSTSEADEQKDGAARAHSSARAAVARTIDGLIEVGGYDERVRLGSRWNARGADRHRVRFASGFSAFDVHLLHVVDSVAAVASVGKVLPPVRVDDLQVEVVDERVAAASRAGGIIPHKRRLETVR